MYLTPDKIGDRQRNPHRLVW